MVLVGRRAKAKAVDAVEARLDGGIHTLRAHLLRQLLDLLPASHAHTNMICSQTETVPHNISSGVIDDSMTTRLFFFVGVTY